MQQYLALTYERAEALLATARSEVRGKPVANNTRLFRRGPDVIALRFHETDVVTFHADGRITLASGGWRTMSTKDRMNHTADITSDERIFACFESANINHHVDLRGTIFEGIAGLKGFHLRRSGSQREADDRTNRNI